MRTLIVVGLILLILGCVGGNNPLPVPCDANVMPDVNNPCLPSNLPSVPGSNPGDILNQIPSGSDGFGNDLFGSGFSNLQWQSVLGSDSGKPVSPLAIPLGASLMQQGFDNPLEEVKCTDQEVVTPIKGGEKSLQKITWNGVEYCQMTVTDLKGTYWCGFYPTQTSSTKTTIGVGRISLTSEGKRFLKFDYAIRQVSGPNVKNTKEIIQCNVLTHKGVPASNALCPSAFIDPEEPVPPCGPAVLPAQEVPVECPDGEEKENQAELEASGYTFYRYSFDGSDYCVHALHEDNPLNDGTINENKGCYYDPVALEIAPDWQVNYELSHHGQGEKAFVETYSYAIEEGKGKVFCQYTQEPAQIDLTKQQQKFCGAQGSITIASPPPC